MNQPNPNEQKEEQALDPAQADYQQGLEFLQNGSYGQAANALHNALMGFEEKNDLEGLANANDKLGDVCLAQEQYEKAAVYYEEAYSICKKFDDLMSLLALRRKLILCHRGMKNYDAALQIYLEMLDFYEAMNNPASSVETIVGMAETYQESGDLQEAIDAYRTAADIHANFKHNTQAEKLRERARELEAQL
jgi:tetratricopeptide (TPR) repeat protein